MSASLNESSTFTDGFFRIFKNLEKLDLTYVGQIQDFWSLKKLKQLKIRLSKYLFDALTLNSL